MRTLRPRGVKSLGLNHSVQAVRLVLNLDAGSDSRACSVKLAVPTERSGEEVNALSGQRGLLVVLIHVKQDGEGVRERPWGGGKLGPPPPISS